MTVDEVHSYFKTDYRFAKATGMTSSCMWHWRKKGYIPVDAQFKIEKVTSGVLKASIDDLKRPEDLD